MLGFMVCVYIYIYIYRGGTVHRCHGSVRTASIQGKKLIYYVQFLFMYFEQTLEQINIFST